MVRRSADNQKKYLPNYQLAPLSMKAVIEAGLAEWIKSKRDATTGRVQLGE